MSTAAATKERPILFNGEMVRAIIEGRKTQTRRIVNPQPTHRLIDGLAHVTIGMDPADDGAVWYDANGKDPGREVRCPHGRVGDRLWVRETWSAPKGIDDLSPKQMGERALDANYRRPWAPIRYWADMERRDWDESVWGKEDGKTRVSIHMPRWASRITLEITGVRAERLQDISQDDALAEGFKPLHNARHMTFEELKAGHAGHPYTAREVFLNTWKEIYRDQPENPWVWVIEFHRV